MNVNVYEFFVGFVDIRKEFSYAACQNDLPSSESGDDILRSKFDYNRVKPEELKPP